MIEKIKSIMTSLPDTSNRLWQVGSFVFLLIIMIIHLLIGIVYHYKYGQFSSAPSSVANLLSIRNQRLSAISFLPRVSKSVSSELGGNPVYRSISTEKLSLYNWRPLTVRLAGYLGGIHGPMNGVFDMETGIKYALDQGARAFIFEIDYLEVAPCIPVIMYRDSGGTLRSLNNGSIQKACETINKYAFSEGAGGRKPIKLKFNRELYLKKSKICLDTVS